MSISSVKRGSISTETRAFKAPVGGSRRGSGAEAAFANRRGSGADAAFPSSRRGSDATFVATSSPCPTPPRTGSQGASRRPRVRLRSVSLTNKPNPDALAPSSAADGKGIPGEVLAEDLKRRAAEIKGKVKGKQLGKDEGMCSSGKDRIVK